MRPHDQAAMRRRDPQRKKALSYKRDRRYDYGQNDKASRRLIPLRKRKVARASRKLANQELPRNLPALEPDEADEIDARVRTARPRTWWVKAPDIPLGEFIARQRKAAAARSGRKRREREARMRREPL
jgi:hypothetical protein